MRAHVTKIAELTLSLGRHLEDLESLPARLLVMTRTYYDDNETPSFFVLVSKPQGLRGRRLEISHARDVSGDLSPAARKRLQDTRFLREPQPLVSVVSVWTREKVLEVYGDQISATLLSLRGALQTAADAAQEAARRGLRPEGAP